MVYLLINGAETKKVSGNKQNVVQLPIDFERGDDYNTHR